MNKLKIAAGVSAAAIVIATPFVANWEGLENDPYLDIVKVPTVCYGQTGVPMRRYSDAECMAMLNTSIEKTYAPAVFKCAPGLATRRYAAAASISLTYNIGARAFCQSTAAKRFNAGDIAGGCRALTRFNMAGGKVVHGLKRRRQAEYNLCMRDAA